MHLEEGKVYHIYNIGNQHQKIFFTDENYLFFLRKIRKYLFPVCDILCWCLMPNHFHFMVYANSKTVKQAQKRKAEVCQFAENLRIMLSQYAQAINKQEGFEGSLFRQNTKAKCLYETNSNKYVVNCFHYIHQNPMNAGLVKKMEHWVYSSFNDYTGIRNGKLCNKEMAQMIINFDETNFYEQSYIILNDSDLKNIW